MANSAVYAMKLLLNEDVDFTGAITDPTVQHDTFTALSGSYTAGGSPDHDTSWSVLTRLVSTGDLDLTSLTDTLGDALDLTTKKIHAIMIKHTGASGAITFKNHATNGYGIFGLESLVVLAVGGSILLLQNGGNEAVSATAKIIEITGTGSDSFDMAISAGD